MVRLKFGRSGSATLEYAILMPIIFACVYAAIAVIMILYQKTLVQNIAENAVQSLARQWGYKPLPVDEMITGVYKKKTYEDREIYWNIKLLNNAGKAKSSEEAINKMVMGTGLLKKYPPGENSISGEIGINTESPVAVTYVPGLPSTLKVDIKMAYRMPGARLMKLLGMGDFLIIEGHGKALVYDAKDTINTTDYVIQIIRETKLYQSFMTKITPLKENIDKLLQE